MKKTLIKVLTAAVAFVMTFSLFTGCNTTPSANALNSYVSLSINPLVELIVDEDNIVTAVNCANSDAEILLSDVDLVGKTVEEASELFLQLATEAGYIDVESQDNEITVTVVSGDTDVEQGIKNKVRERLTKYFENNGIFGKVSEETLESFGEEIDALDIPTGKKKMILRALEEDPTLDINELKDMAVNELVKLFKGKINDGLGSELRQQFNQQKEALKEQYRDTAQQMFEDAKTAIRAQYQNMFTLEDEIEALQQQLEGFEGSDDEKTALENQLQTKQSQYNALKVDFEAAMEQARIDFEQAIGEYHAQMQQLQEQIQQKLNEFQEQKEQLKLQQKEQKRQKIEANSQKMEQHRQKMNNNSENSNQQGQGNNSENGNQQGQGNNGGRN